VITGRLTYDAAMLFRLIACAGLAISLLGCETRRPIQRIDSGPGGGLDTGVPTGVDAPFTFGCTPGLQGCLGTTLYVCGPDGETRTNEMVCPEQCDARLGCVTCRPGERRCNGTVSEVCNSDGSGFGHGRDCADWAVECGGDGFCSDMCADAERTSSNVGCEYWPVPLANTQELGPDTFDFRVVITNPNDVPANVRVMRGETMTWSGTLEPRGIQDVSLPWVEGQSFNVPGAGWSSFVANGAYRLLSDAPVIVSQFNPFEYEVGGVYSYTNDASLLLPAHVLTGRYVAATYVPLSISVVSMGPFGGGSTDPFAQPGYVAIVGIQPGTTTVQVATTGNVAGSTDRRIPRTGRGRSFVITLERGEVAHILADTPPDCGAGRSGYREVPMSEGTRFACNETDHDLTGTRITADRPIAVFGGHTCAYVPYYAQACDHIEEQIPPIETLGREYVGAPMGDGSLSGTNIVRVIAGASDTAVTIEGASGSRTLATGEYVEFEATRPFRVSATQGVMVAQYLRGQFASTPEAARGDPAMTLLVPSEQFRRDYTFILPTSYNAGTNGQNYLLVTRPPGLDIQVDGAPVSASFTPIGSSEIGVVSLPGGTHTMSADGPFGILAYGLGSFTSYATPAGLNLEPINILF
jgi:hypothetical protein